MFLDFGYVQVIKAVPTESDPELQILELRLGF